MPTHPPSLQSDPDNANKFDYDWWSKYYYSIGDDRRTQKDYVVVYPGELEDAFNRSVGGTGGGAKVVP